MVTSFAFGFLAGMCVAIVIFALLLVGGKLNLRKRSNAPWQKVSKAPGRHRDGIRSKDAVNRESAVVRRARVQQERRPPT